jgi:hypothetical protein
MRTLVSRTESTSKNGSPFFKAKGSSNFFNVQAKLSVGQPGDKYEKEADKMADRVIFGSQNQSNNFFLPASLKPLQKQTTIGDKNPASGKEILQEKPLIESITPLVQMQAEEEPVQMQAEEEPVQMQEEEESVQKLEEEESIQKQEEEESVQKQEEEEVQKQAENKSNFSYKPESYQSLESKLQNSKGGGSSLPDNVRTQMENGFKADFSGVRAHTDSSAVQMNKQLGAKAFTRGNDIYFNEGAYNPGADDGKHLLAHELTHVIQQKAATKMPDQIIQRYTVYKSSDQTGGKSLGWTHPASVDLNVADDGRLAVGKKDAWAEDTLIKDSEAILKSINSDIKLTQGTRTISGKEPNKGTAGTSKSLNEVSVINRTGGGRADLTADCGTTARQVMGINSSSEKFSAVIKPDGTGTESYSDSETYRGGSHTTTEAWFENILRKEYGSGFTATELRTKYEILTVDKKKAFDRKYGINKYASPNVGQAITIDRPSGWNFHFAGVILKSGEDYATTENFPRAGRNSQSWYFKMYGPMSKGQTFYDKWADSSGSTAMVVESDKARTGNIIQDTNLVYGLGKDILVELIKEENTWIKVNILSGVSTGKTGWISSDSLPSKEIESIKGQKIKTIKATNVVMTKLTKGDEVIVYQRSNLWRDVILSSGKFKGWRGWIKNEHFMIK